MKLLITDINAHFFNSLKHYLPAHCSLILKRHTEITDKDINADFWFFSFNPNVKTFIEREDYLMEFAERFEGKICYFLSSDHGMPDKLYLKYEFFFKRVYCIFASTETKTTREKFERRILFPKFTINYIPFQNSIKCRAVYFRGSLTGGGGHFRGFNPRIEALKQINQLNENWIDYKLYATQQQRLFTHRFIKDADTTKLIESLPDSILLSKPDYISTLSCNIASLCMPGNAVWCYRHLESIAVGCNIVSMSVKNDPGLWLNNDKLDECFVLLEYDLSNLKDACEYSLSDCEQLYEKRKYAYNLYQQEFELTPGNYYKENVWEKIEQKMQEFSIIF